MLKYGIISEVDGSKGLVRVNFDADEFVSDWLPVICNKTLNDKSQFPLEDGEHVACLMEDEHCENGVCLGAIYNESDLPAAPINTNSVFGMKFANGDYFKYDKSAGALDFKIGTTNIKSDGTKATVITSGVTIEATASQLKVDIAGDSLKAILNDMLTQIEAITCIYNDYVTALPAPTSPPVNLSAFVGIQARVNSIFN